MSLAEYQRKRNFAKTAEPRAAKPTKRGFRFVIQKHAASRLHYDFRLELGGTLKSWAVPKGIPFEHGEKRLAMRTEDHPVSYLDFEGTIPAGQYGGGTMMVWDHGTFEPHSKAPLKELDGGKLHFELRGEKVQGEWYLVRLRDEKEWLLIRGGESLKPLSRKRDDTSVISGLSMKQLAKGDRAPKAIPGAKARPTPEFVEPMKAKLAAHAPTSGDWIYEIKFDGYRALALRGGDESRLLSRNEKNFGAKFPDVLAAISRLKVKDAILDGEIVALDSSGKSSFQLLQQFEMGREQPPLFFYVFDALQIDGKDLRSQPLLERKRALEKILPKKEGILRYSAALGADSAPLLEQAQKLGLEGLIGKRADSAYETGQRSGAWIKLKLLAEQEFVIGGFTNPEGSRKFFGSLIVGVYQKRKLVFSGRVGTGFSHAVLRSLHERLSGLAVDECPFSDLPQPRASKWGQAITASEMKRCHWVKPTLVAQVKFAEWTADHHLRQPVFLGLREDKDAVEVVREKASA